MPQPTNHVQESKLRLVINRLFGETDEDLFNEIKLKFQYVDLPAGTNLMHQGDEGESVYLLLGGRLRVFVTDEKGIRKTVGTIFQGEIVGEMSLLTGETRSASVVAVRDSTLAELKREQFEEIIAGHPALVKNITKMVIQRLKRMNIDRKISSDDISMAVINIHRMDDFLQFCNQLKSDLQSTKTVSLITLQLAVSKTGIEIDYNTSSIDPNNQQILNSWLDEQENEFEAVILLQDKDFHPWTRMIIKRADILLIAVDSQQDPSITQLEQEIQDAPYEEITTTRYLLLRHFDNIAPRATKEWISQRNVTKHFHLRKNNREDFSRLSRFLGGNSTGLVLGGGGAKGIAHIGIYKALQEFNIPIDLIGGTSIGAIIAGFIGQGLHAEEIIRLTRDMFLANPTPLSEFSIFPFYGLLNGNRLEKMLANCFGKIDVEDLPMNYFCVSSNLTTSNLHVHHSGDLKTAIRASISLPGILPPVIINKNVFVDGGIFNNMPIDIMSSQGAAQIIAVSLSKGVEDELQIDELPNKYSMLAHRLFRKSKQQFNLPTLMNTLVKSTTLYSDSREKETVKSADILFNPDVSHFGLTNWARFNELVEVGYKHAIKVLSNLPKDDVQ